MAIILIGWMGDGGFLWRILEFLHSTYQSPTYYIDMTGDSTTMIAVPQKYRLQYSVTTTAASAHSLPSIKVTPSDNASKNLSPSRHTNQSRSQ